ncbi:hypothetical protein V7S43_002112 [Phytophthora oleae]|uniref:SP-RING-type domain-containing protein n=1 Tax=Phytophthora oleae TaxID=2107226 RepID=A0ABD3G159_9STRA
MTRAASPMEEEAAEPPQEQTTIDLTAQADLQRDTPQRGEPDESGGVIDLTDDTVVAPVPPRHSREQRREIAALRQELEQANETRTKFQDMVRRILDEQEAVLTCPIAYELFENPVVTECCGKTFSSEALTQVLRANHRCPVCRSARVKTHPSRDMANLVEVHKSDRSVLEEAESKTEEDSTAPAEQSHNEEPPPSLRQRGNQQRRRQRVHARAAIARPQPAGADAAPAPAEPPPVAGPAGGQVDWETQYLLWLVDQNDG